MLTDLHHVVLGLILAGEIVDAETVAERLELSREIVDQLFDDLEREGMIAPAVVH